MAGVSDAIKHVGVVHVAAMSTRCNYYSELTRLMHREGFVTCDNNMIKRDECRPFRQIPRPVCS